MCWHSRLKFASRHKNYDDDFSRSLRNPTDVSSFTVTFQVIIFGFLIDEVKWEVLSTHKYFYLDIVSNLPLGIAFRI